MTQRWTWRLLRAGAFKLDAGAMFGLVPKPLWSRMVTPDERNRMPLNTNCLLLEGGGKRVLIEAGIGDKSSPKQREIYEMEDRSAAAALVEIGVEPESIDSVIVSHLHFDHAGGLTTLNRDGKPVPTFPRAEVISQRQEWEDALANKSTMHSTYLREHLDPVADRVRLIDGEGEVLPGIRVAPMPGHTWGQQAVFFEDERKRTIVFPADVMPTVNHVGLTYNMAYDQLPYENMLRKRAFLSAAAERGWIIALDHEPGPAVVRVVAGEREGTHRLEVVEGD